MFKRPLKLSFENFVFKSLLFSGLIEKFKAVEKSAFSKLELSKIDFDKSQESNFTEVKLQFEKSTSTSLEFMNLEFFKFILKNEQTCKTQESKDTSKRKSLQYSNCTPNILQSLKTTALNDVVLMIGDSKWQFINSQFTNSLLESVVLLKLQELKTQVSYSPISKGVVK